MGNRYVVMHPETRFTAIESNAARVRVVALLCVLLVAVGACAQAVHVHSGSSGLPRYECSICLAALSGIVVSNLFHPDPVFVKTALFVPPQEITQSSGFVSSPHIRPPPSA